MGTIGPSLPSCVLFKRYTPVAQVENHFLWCYGWHKPKWSLVGRGVARNLLREDNTGPGAEVRPPLGSGAEPQLETCWIFHWRNTERCLRMFFVLSIIDYTVKHRIMNSENRLIFGKDTDNTKCNRIRPCIGYSLFRTEYIYRRTVKDTQTEQTQHRQRNIAYAMLPHFCLTYSLTLVLAYTIEMTRNM